MTAPSAYTLQSVMSLVSQARARMAEDGVIDTDGAELFAECPDAETALLRVCRAIDEAAGNADAVGARMTDLDARWKRHKRQHEELRALLVAMLEAMALDKWRHPEFTVSLSAGKPGVVVTDVAALPDTFVRIKREPDKVAIGCALAEGRDVPGAMRTNAQPVLRITTK